MSSELQLGKRARTRATLITIAFELFREKGIVRTSLEEVATRAGMTKGAVYSSFRSKQELVAAVMEAESLEIQPAFRPGMSEREIYRAVGEAVVAMMPTVHAHGALVVEFHLYAITHEALRPWLSAAYAKAFQGVIGQVTDLNPDRPAPPHHKILTVQALILGLVQQRLLTPELVSDEEIMAVFEGLA